MKSIILILIKKRKGGNRINNTVNTVILYERTTMETFTTSVPVYKIFYWFSHLFASQGTK